MKEAYQELINNDSSCLKCSYNRIRKSVDNTPLDRFQSASSNVQRTESDSWKGEKFNIVEIDNRLFENISEETRQIILNRFLEKTDALLKLSTANFESVCSFRSKINKTFSVNDIKKAYDYLLQIICTNINTFFLWHKSIREVEDLLKENSNSNQIKTPEKRRSNLSLIKSDNLTTVAESLDDNVNISLDVEQVTDNSKVEENAKQELEENIDATDDNSNHSIFSQATNDLGLDTTKEIATVFGKFRNSGVDLSVLNETLDEESSTQNSLNESEDSFVFTIGRSSDASENSEDNSHLELPNINVDGTIKEEFPIIMSKESNCTDFLGLESTQEEDEEVDDCVSETIEKENHMLRLLLNIEDTSFTMSEQDSLSDGFEDQESNEYIQLPEGIYGIITNTLPTLPSTNNDMLVDTDEENLDNHNDNVVKACSVVLEKMDEIVEVKERSGTKEEDEIERLINLTNLENKRKSSFHEGTSSKKAKRTKTVSGSDTSCLESDSDDSNGILDELLENNFPSEHRDISDEVLENLLNKISDDEDNDQEDNSEEDSEEESSNPTDADNPNKSIKTSDVNSSKVCPGKENESEENNSTTNKSPKKDNNSSWKLDPLLNFSLKEKAEKPRQSNENVIPDTSSKAERKDSSNTNEKNEDETTESIDIKPNYVSDDDDEDVEAKYNKIIVNSESDSDIEFVSVERNVKKKLNDSVDSEIRRGRKNIREILDDTTLTEATKEANLLERKRKSRLNQKQKNMDAILSQSQFSEDDDGLILDFDETTKIPNVVVHPRLTNKLKPHQRAGVKFMWESCYEGIKQIKDGYQGSGCILAHCMGLGKTLQVITLIHTLFKHNIANIKHVLIVSPLSIVLHWEKEFQEAMKYTGDNLFRVFCISTGKAIKANTISLWQKHNGVLVMGYDCYNRLALPKNPVTFQEYNNLQSLVDPGPDLIVLDEGHVIKNEKTLRSKSFRNLKTKRRIILTGTPLQNNLNEYYFMIQFVKPNLLGSLPEYKNRFANPITNGQYHDSTEVDIITMKKRSHVLNKLLKGTVQRFELSELVPYLKKRHDYALFIQLHPFQMNLYEKQAALACSNMQDGNYATQVISNYHKFQFICCHPYMFHLKEKAAQEERTNNGDLSSYTDYWWKGYCPPDSDINIDYGPKFKVMLSIIKECEKMGDKILVFSNSIFELNAIEHFLRQYSTSESQWIPNEDYVRMDGSTPSDLRIQLCDSFNNKNNRRKRLFLISNRVGGMGINLIGANRVILMDVNWNPAIDSQSVFRVYRFGQEKECFVYRLISMGTMEEVVYERQVTKLAIAGRVIDSLQITRHFNSNDLQMLYRPKLNRGQTRPTPPLPADSVLAKVLQSCTAIFRYHEHQSLLENLPEENLNDDDLQLAWEEFNKESDRENVLQMKKKSTLPSATENLSNHPTNFGINPVASSSTSQFDPAASFSRPVVAQTAQNVILEAPIKKNVSNEIAYRAFLKKNMINNKSNNKTSSIMNPPVVDHRFKKANGNDITNLENRINLNKNYRIVNNSIQSIQNNSTNILPHRTKNPAIHNLLATDPNDKFGNNVGASRLNTVNLEETELDVGVLNNRTDTIINLDDINDCNFLTNEQQTLISSLNQNLDITLSTLATERNRNQKIDNIIEID